MAKMEKTLEIMMEKKVTFKCLYVDLEEKSTDKKLYKLARER